MAFFEGFLQGIAGGIAEGQRKREREEEIKLRKRLVEAEERLKDIQFKKVQREETGLGNLRQLLLQGEPQLGPTIETEPRDVPIGEVERPDLPRVAPSPQSLRAAMIEAGLEKEAVKTLPAFQKPATPTGAESRIFDILVRKNTQPETVTPGELKAIEDYQKSIGGIASQRAGGAETGRLGIRSFPKFQQTEQRISKARGLGRGEASQNLPLGENAGKWFHPTTLQAPSANLSQVEARKQGFQPSPPGATNAAESARAFLGRLDEYDKFIDLLPKGTGNFSEDQVNVLKNYGKLKLQANIDPRVNNFLALSQSTAQAAKAFGDAANISIIEQAQVRKQLPRGLETQEVAKAQIAQMRKLIRTAASRGFKSSKTSLPTAPPLPGLRIEQR